MDVSHAASAPPAIQVRSVVPIPLHLASGVVLESRMFTFGGLSDGREHLAVQLGDTTSGRPLVRPHSECLTGDVFGSYRCDCGPQLQEALLRIHQVGGYLLYLRQEGRGIGLYNKLDAYRLQEQGYDTYEANVALGLSQDGRDYQVAAEMLQALGARDIDILSNNPDKVAQLTKYGINIHDVHPTGAFVSPHNRRYLVAKVNKTRHTIDLEVSAP